MSKETRIGILAVIAVALGLWGYKFILGKNMLSSSQVFYIDYENSNDLALSAPVKINGFQIGVVTDIKLKEDLETIQVTLDIDRGIRIPKNAVAEIVATGLMGGRAIVINVDKPCGGPDCAQSGDYLKGNVRNIVSSMVGEPEEITAYMKQLEGNIGPIADTLKNRIIGGGENEEIEQMMNDVKIILANLKTTTYSVNNLLKNSTNKVNDILGSVEQLSATLEENNNQIKGIISNTNDLTAKLATVDIDATLDTANQAIAELRTMLSSTQGTVDEVGVLVKNINGDEGALGKLFLEEELLTRIDSISLKADALLDDIETRPYRYIPLKSRRKVLKYDRLDEN